MFASSWLIVLFFSCNSQKVKCDLLKYSHVMIDGTNSTSMSFLNSIVESFEKWGQIYCAVIIHDDIGINVHSTFISKKCGAESYYYVKYGSSIIT